MICKTNDGLDLYYERHGNAAAGTTLVFLNGLTQSTAAWGLMVPYFKSHYSIVLLDFIFQGRSDKQGTWRNFDQHAADVKCVLDQEKIGQAVIIGISYGSLVAQHFALLYPQRLSKLVLLSTFAHKTPYYEAIELSWWKALEIGGYALLLDIMLPSVLSETYFAHPVVPLEAMKEARKDLNQNAEAIFNLMRATRERGDFRKALQGIRASTLILHGEKDALLPVHLAKEVQRHITNSTLTVIAGAGHTLNLEHVNEVAQHILKFLGN